jgi:hypothetical protein
MTHSQNVTPNVRKSMMRELLKWDRIWSSLKKNLDITNNKNFNGSVYMTLYAQKSDFKE